MPPKNQPLFEQFSLFDDAYTLVNSGLADLIALNLEAARDSFEHYGELYRAREQVEDYLRVITFLEEELKKTPANEAEPAHLYDLLKAFEKDAFATACLPRDLLDGIRFSFHRRILQAIADHHLQRTPYLSNSIPTGYLYLQAGRPDEAIPALQACLPLSPDNALIYGYLGDAYTMRDELAEARQCYLNACLDNPGAVNWKFLKDSELVSLKDKLTDHYGSEALALAWLPVHAILNNLFQPKLMGLFEGLKELVEDYLDLRKRFLRNQEPRLKAGLFIRALLLCHQEPHLKFIKTVNFIDLRKEMKSLDPSLFARYLQWIERRCSNRK